MRPQILQIFEGITYIFRYFNVLAQHGPPKSKVSVETVYLGGFRYIPISGYSAERHSTVLPCDPWVYSIAPDPPSRAAWVPAAVVAGLRVRLGRPAVAVPKGAPHLTEVPAHRHLRLAEVVHALAALLLAAHVRHLDVQKSSSGSPSER